MSKYTILGIPVTANLFFEFKYYVSVVKKHRDDDWSLGYSYAYLEISLEDALSKNFISQSEYWILWSFAHNLTLSRYSRYKLYTK